MGICGKIFLSQRLIDNLPSYGGHIIIKLIHGGHSFIQMLVTLSLLILYTILRRNIRELFSHALLKRETVYPLIVYR